MGLTRLAITRPLAILMLILGIVLMGVVSYTRLKIDRLPPISVPFLSVNIGYPGASPEDVESLILQPLEDALGGVPGAISLQATAREGSGSVNIQLSEEANLDAALVDVQRRLASIAPQLPKDAGDPRVNKFDPNASPVMNLALTGSELKQLFDLANDVVMPKLLSIPGVADVNLSGGLQREIQVRLDVAKLTGYGISVDQVTSALQRENVSSPAGRLDQGRTSLAVRSMGLFQKTDDLANLIVGTRNNSPVYLRNVATIVDTNKEPSRYLRFDGEEAVGLSVTKQSDANTIQVAAAVKAALGPLTVAMPPGSKLVVVTDNSRFVRRSRDAVQSDLFLAAFLTASVLLLFLHTWRNTLIVLLSIPTSLIATFLVMYAFGFSLNIMTLMALAMTIGVLVDDSIVVLENIHRHLHQGAAPMAAAIAGRSEIGLAAIAITFTDIVVYLPVAFMQGNVGQLFQQYGITVATATLFSLFVSFTLTPMLASRWLKTRDEDVGTGPWSRFTRGWERAFDAFSNSYGSLMGRLLGARMRLVVVGIAAVAVGISVWMPFAHVLGTEFAPQEDDGIFSVNLQMPTGTSLAATNEAAHLLEDRIQKELPELVSMFSSAGGGGGFNSNTNNANITVEVVDKSHRSRSLDAIREQVRLFARTIPEASVRTNVQNPLPAGQNVINISLLGDDLTVLGQLSDQVAKVAEETPGVSGTRASFQPQQPEVRFSVDRERASAAGITATQAGAALRTVLQGSTVSQLRAEGEPALDITVIGEGSTTLTPAALSNVPVGITRSGAMVSLAQVARLQNGRSPVQISRLDRKRTVSVNADVTGRTVGDVARDLRANLTQVAMPPGYRWDIQGTVQRLDQAFAGLFAALMLSVLLIYMLLVALYESLLTPLSIMFSLPVALLGAFVGLLVTGNTLNIFSIIGVIALMGLVAKNAILLVDYTNTLRQRGLARNEALMEAGRARLRPIIMTSATVVAAMMPLAFKFEAGAESRAPMAVVIVGGVISSTVLTLGLVPVMYTILDDLQRFLKLPAEFRWPWHQRSPALDFVPVEAHVAAPARPLALPTTMERTSGGGGD
ncbi:MAG: efflux RND transporter permease subunit [Dehalococcoidia bacterium]|nr:efflux RND transporter permease subunit [Dehalococcoidia bacterium]